MQLAMLQELPRFWETDYDSAYATKFSGTYSQRTIDGGIGHNLPQEAPEAFADAVLEVGGSVA